MLKAIGTHAVVQVVEKDTTALKELEFVDTLRTPEEKVNIGRIISIGNGWDNRWENNGSDDTPCKIGDIILFDYYDRNTALKHKELRGEKIFCFVDFHNILAVVDSSVVF